ncbi:MULTISPECIES: ABC transporter permease [unclassified Caballeronia]|uniref:ABC transporter permease n=1 Tax=unclassified Caballeronia TaxID=2646786 RepID=UPI0020290FCB|nr:MULTISPECIES: ABC transporter permease [unclassified Caballeronia]MDR5804191.1 ABC transporter permease [Caballeronia sp. LZ001]
MQRNSIAPASFFRSMIGNRHLVRQMVVREIASRYRGSALGIVWSFFIPVLMLAIYTFVFSFVFKARWRVGNDSKTEFALVLFAGLMLFNMFADCVNRAPLQIVSNVNLVKKVVFPLEILSVVAVAASIFQMLVSLVVWLVFYVAVFGVPPVTALWLPLIALPLVLITLGVTWFLAALGVYLRDVAQITGVITTTLMFLTPIFFPASAVPEQFQILFLINPLASIIELARNALIWGKSPDPFMCSYLIASSVAVAWLGFACFQKTRGGFSDVL